MNHKDSLKPLLESWQVPVKHDPDFEVGVWSRIQANELSARAETRRFEWALPLAASVAVLFSIAAGTQSALSLNQTQSTERMATAYVRSVDPIQMSNSHAHERS